MNHPTRVTPTLVQRLAAIVTLWGVVASTDSQAQTIQAGSDTVRIEATAVWPGADASAVAGGALQEGSPTDLVQLPDGTGRYLMITQGGKVHLMDSAGRFTSSPDSPMLGPVETGNTIPFNLRYGLVSLTVHPDFAAPGTFGYGKAYGIASQPAGAATSDFVQTATSAHNHQSVLFEYDLRDLVGEAPGALPNFARREVLRVRQAGGSHNMFDLAFRSNGELYISIGDGTANSLNSTSFRLQDAQDLDSAYGKVFRIHPDPVAFRPADRGRLGDGRISDNQQYSISSDNPFFDGGGSNDGSNVDEIYANGVRSPFRINVDPNDEDIVWLGDVGEGRNEEVNRIVRGGNYGWGLFEGTSSAPDPTNSNPVAKGNLPLIPPTLEYSHFQRPGSPGVSGGGVSVTGGFVYRGELLGEDYQGVYLGAELGNYFNNGSLSRLFTGDPEAGGTSDPVALLIDPDGTRFDNRSLGEQGLPNLITSIGESLNGELWVLGLDGTASPGINEGPGEFLPGELVLARILPEGYIPAAGDYNHDGQINSWDHDIWLADYGWKAADFPGGPHSPADGNNDGVVDAADYTVWRDALEGASAAQAAVPEPAAATLLTLCVLVGQLSRRRNQ